MAKDTEKLIRQLSLISYLMAERRPVTALEIRRDVEGYSGMNEDAFARRFYADRAELDSLGIQLTVDRPADGAAEQENYSLRPENFHLPAIEFTDDELAALQVALSLLDGEFAYAEPLRLALQQITWGRPSPLDGPEQNSLALGITASAGGHELSQRLAKIETAIFRQKTVTFDYFTMERDEIGSRKVDPYHLLFRGGQFYLLGWSHEREAIRVFRLSRIQGKVAYATKAEHDFKRPEEFDPREYASRADWQFGDEQGVAEILVSERIAWQVERNFGRFGEIEKGDGDVVFTTPYSSSRQLISFVFSLGEHAKIAGPPELIDETRERIALIVERHDGLVPDVHDELLALPGVGEYTAGAVRAFAYGQPGLALDTNVRRVLARHDRGLPDAVGSVTVEERRRAAELMPAGDAAGAAWMAGLMELGALICTSRAPRCEACPISGDCAWLALGRPAGAERRRQAAYDGSDRQARGALLAVLRASDAPVTQRALDVAWPDAIQRARALDGLVADGLVVPASRNRWSLPS